MSQLRPGQRCCGNVARVRLAIDGQADVNWVAISNPIPAGATILGTVRRQTKSATGVSKLVESFVSVRVMVRRFDFGTLVVVAQGFEFDLLPQALDGLNPTEVDIGQRTTGFRTILWAE